MGNLQPGPKAQKKKRVRRATPRVRKATGNKKHSATIRAKRATVTVGAIKEKQANGTAHGEERALVRVGKTGTNVLTGKDDLSEWDDEELRRGQRRDKNGRFQGRAPVVVPKALHDELVKRTLTKAQQKLIENTERAVEELVEIVKSSDADDQDKLKAIGMVMDRVMGKAPERIHHTGETPKWMLAIQAGVVTIEDPGIVDEPEDEEDVIDV